MDQRRNWRESLTVYTDIDALQHELAVTLGIVAPNLTSNEVKSLYWSKNPIGDALAEFLFALARAGVLETHPDDETLLRWNPSFRGW